MGKYKIVFSDVFDKRLKIIEQDFLGFGKVHTDKYIEEIIAKCQTLSTFPVRHEEIEINGVMYRRIYHKAHTVFYRVFEAEKLIYIDTVLGGEQKAKLHI